MTKKQCSRCKEEKSLGDFYTRAISKDGRMSHCKACAAIADRNRRLKDVELTRQKDAVYRANKMDKARVYMAEYRARNKDRIQSNIKKIKARNPERYLVAAARKRALDRGTEFTITENDIHIPTYCPVFGTPLKASLVGKRDLNSPSIDRIDNSKGYIRGNVAVISYRANMIKSIGTADEHEAIAKWMRNYQ